MSEQPRLHHLLDRGDAMCQLREQTRAALRSAGISQADACRQLGVSTKHLSHMLTGRAPLTLDWAERLLALCGQQLLVTVAPNASVAAPTRAQRIPLDDLTSDQLDALYDRLELFNAAAHERSAILEAARDALENVGVNRAHGDDWPRLAPAIEELAAERDAARDRLDFHDRDTLPRLQRRIEHDAETIHRWRGRAESAELRANQAEAEVTRLTAGQCIDSRRMCDLHHTKPVDGCPYPRCLNTQKENNQ
jgi:transcriptional regulator with XRE-family HTH domain